MDISQGGPVDVLQRALATVVQVVDNRKALGVCMLVWQSRSTYSALAAGQMAADARHPTPRSTTNKICTQLQHHQSFITETYLL